MNVGEKLKEYISSLKYNQLILIDSFKDNFDGSVYNYVVLIGILNDQPIIKLLDKNRIILNTYSINHEYLEKKTLWLLNRCRLHIKSLTYVVDNTSKEVLFDFVNCDTEVEFSLSAQPTRYNKLEISYTIHKESIDYVKLVECFNELKIMLKQEYKLGIVYHQVSPIKLLRLRKMKSLGLDDLV